MNKTNLLLVLILAVLLVVGGYLIFSEKLFSLPQEEKDSTSQPPLDKTLKQTPEQESSPSQSVPKETSDGWKTYQDSEGGFKFQYPSDFVLYNSDHPDYPQGSFFKTTGESSMPTPIRVVAVFPQDAYPNTDFVSAWVAVSYNPAISNASDCKALEKNGSVYELSQEKIVNGVTWHRGDTGGVAAGTSFNNKVYHTLYNKICYEVALNFATISRGYYLFEDDQNAIKSSDFRAEAWRKLDDIFLTFRFPTGASISGNIHCDSTGECTKLAIKEENPLYCQFAKDPVPEGGEDVQPTDGDLYCLRELVSVVKDVSICNQYAPNDSVCIWRATYSGE